jgi:hypothetical protein
MKMATTRCIQACALDSLVDYFDVETCGYVEEKSNNKEGYLM